MSLDLTALPELVFSLICQYLDPPSTSKLQRTCYSISKMISRNEFWNDLCHAHYPWREFSEKIQTSRSCYKIYQDLARPVTGSYFNVGKYLPTEVHSSSDRGFYHYNLDLFRCDRQKHGCELIGRETDTSEILIHGLQIGTTIVGVQYFFNKRDKEGYYSCVIGSISPGRFDSRWVNAWDFGVSSAVQLFKDPNEPSPETERSLERRLESFPNFVVNEWKDMYQDGIYVLKTSEGVVEIPLRFHVDKRVGVVVDGEWERKDGEWCSLLGIANEHYLVCSWEENSYEKMECFIGHASKDHRSFEGVWTKLHEISKNVNCTLFQKV